MTPNSANDGQRSTAHHILLADSTAATWAVCVSLLIAMIPPNGVLNDNEEHYFALALSFVDIDSLPPASAVMGGMAHAFGFSWIVGNLILLVGFEVAQIVGRLATAILYAVALTRLFRTAAVGPIDATIALAGFYIAGQELMGGEWLFGGAEPKALAYPLVILGTALILEGRFLAAALAFSAATYMHFLIGGFWATLAFASVWLDGRSLRRLLAPIGTYVMVVGPLIAFLVHVGYTTSGSTESPTEPTVGWIVTYFRSPHHSTPFGSLRELVNWSPGLLVTIATLGASITMTAATDKMLRRLGLLVSLGSAYLLAAFLLTALDRGGVLGPFSVFRPSSFLLFLAILLATCWLKRIPPPEHDTLRLTSAAVLTAIAVPALAMGAAGPLIAQRQLLHQSNPLLEYARQQTPANAVFLIDPSLERAFLGFERRANRSALVMNKFVPTTSSEIREWYRRRRFQDSLFSLGCPSPMAYEVDYLIASPNAQTLLAATCGHVVFSRPTAAIIRVDPRLADGPHAAE